MKLFFDTETTGLDPSVDSILSIACVITNDNLDYLSHIYLEMQPAKPIQFNANLMKALEVNQFDPKEIFNKPTAKDAFTELQAYLGSSGSARKPIVPVGHNVKFDLAMLESDAKFLGMDSMLKMLHYHCEDTMIIAQVAKNFCGRYFKDLKLQTVFEQTGANESEYAKNLHKSMGLTSEGAHNSLYDIFMTICVYKYFMDHFSWKN